MTIALLTPSYAPDFESFRLLHRSVLQCTDPGVVHHAIVPDADMPLFASLRSDRLRLTRLSSLLPRGFVSTQWLAQTATRIPSVPRGARIAAVNRRRPWPPIRSWILQQIVKLRAAERSDADVLVLIDSDAQLIAPIDEARFRVDGAVPLYRKPGGISAAMVRHGEWHRNARRMLGVDPDGPPPYDDPIAGMIAWDPDLVRAALKRIADVSARPWADVVAATWEFSEYVLYGEYHAAFVPPERAVVTDESGCLSWWEPRPLTPDGIDALLATARPEDVVLHIQSTSGTPIDERERVAALLRRR